MLPHQYILNFKRVLPKVYITLPRFYSRKFEKLKKAYKQFSSLSIIFLQYLSKQMKMPKQWFFRTDRLLIITDVTDTVNIHWVWDMNHSNIMMNGQKNIQQYNLQGELIKSIKTKSGNRWNHCYNDWRPWLNI